MSLSYGGGTSVRILYCSHPHDEGDPCVPECHHDPRGCSHEQVDE